MMDCSPVISGYNNGIVKRDPSPRNCRYPIPWLGERSFERSWRCSHCFISEGNQNPRQEEEILQPNIKADGEFLSLKTDKWGPPHVYLQELKDKNLISLLYALECHIVNMQIDYNFSWKKKVSEEGCS